MALGETTSGAVARLTGDLTAPLPADTLSSLFGHLSVLLAGATRGFPAAAVPPENTPTVTATRLASGHGLDLQSVTGLVLRLPSEGLRAMGAVSTPSPPAAPPVSLTTQDVENTISPVNCAGAATAVSGPFLTPPFRGFTRLDSFFDHAGPTFARDGTLVIANGMTFTQSANGSAPISIPPNLPGYWSSGLRQFVYYDGHNGYDLELVYQPVLAAATGRVIFAGWNYPGVTTTGYGRMVLIDDGNGYQTLYGHFARLKVHQGQWVRQGQQLGISGNSGHSTGPHLHFSVFHNCQPTDPYGWTGSGPDPLTAYQGESSANLWREMPNILNPPPHWPGSTRIGKPSSAVALDLVLPQATTVKGLLRRLDGERRAVTAALSARHLPVFYDWSAAAYLFPAGVPPGLLYSLPYAAAVTPDTYGDLYWAAQSFDASLASVVNTRRSRGLVGGPWRASILRFGSQKFLVGSGPPGQSVELATTPAKTMPVAVTSTARGTFAIPLVGAGAGAKLTLISGRRRHALVVPALGGRRHRETGDPKAPPISRTKRARRTDGPSGVSSLLIAPLVGATLIIGALAALARRFRHRRPATRRVIS